MLDLNSTANTLIVDWYAQMFNWTDCHLLAHDKGVW